MTGGSRTCCWGLVGQVSWGGRSRAVLGSRHCPGRRLRPRPASCLTVLLRGSSVLISELWIVGNFQRMRSFLIVTSCLILAASLGFFTHEIGIATCTPGGCRSLVEMMGTGKPSSVHPLHVWTAFPRQGSPSQWPPWRTDTSGALTTLAWTSRAERLPDYFSIFTVFFFFF